MKQWIFLLVAGLLLSCNKSWLDAKPDKALVVPATLTDLQALLDNSEVFNSSQPALGEVGAGDFFLLPTTWQSLNTAAERNAYTWQQDIFEGGRSTDWEHAYQQVFYANTVLEGLRRLGPAAAGTGVYRQLKGSALFYRAYAFFHLAGQFTPPFDPARAGTAAGLPLRLSPDINERTGRSTVAETFERITGDLTQAVPLLPPLAAYKTRPSRAAAYALLGRVYLVLGAYDKAGRYADSALQLQGTLLDYSTLSTAAPYPFARFNPEVIFHHTLVLYGAFSTSRLLVDTTLHRSYADGDLRRVLYFRDVAAGKTFRGSYDGFLYLFGGLATDELYLVRAECRARDGRTQEALSDLNYLLAHRWKKGAFTPLTASSAEEALRLVLAERQKELLLRGLRWADLRRLGSDDRFAQTLTRRLGSEVYTLPPGDARYTLPIPDSEIELSGIEQNPR